nr:4676_t:CDS:2 [Entrophospora candida]
MTMRDIAVSNNSSIAKNEGITNNEVSKQVGEMWHREPMEEKLRFQRMADDAKMEHMKKYPEYKYRPRRPHEKRRRTKRPQSSSNASIDTVSTTETCFDYFGADESRRGSIISLNDFDYGNDFDPLFNDDSHGLLAEEQLTTITSSSSSSPDLQFNVLSNPGNNICVGSNNNSFNTDALDFLMENSESCCLNIGLNKRL